MTPPSTNECLGYNIKEFDGEAPMMVELWQMPLLPGRLWPAVVAAERFLSIGQIELFEI